MVFPEHVCEISA